MVSNGINALKHFAGRAQPTLDLVVISHFDRDHVSGLIELLKSFSVGTLLLPYLPLWQRLIVALKCDASPNDQLMRFLLNPVKYLNEQEGTRIEQVVFVPTTGRNDKAPENNLRANSDDPEPILRVPVEDVLHADMQAEINSFKHHRTKAAVLKRGERLSLGTSWEFVPYNDSKVICKNALLFRQKVTELREQLMTFPSETVIEEIKKAYDSAFGKTSKSRNIVSLFLYIGPTHINNRVVCHATSHENYRDRRWTELLFKPTKASLIYTGDGYLNTDSRIQRFKDFLGPDRLKEILCLQVMHHGSKNNWQIGLADIPRPHLSVFSSDPTHKLFQHPDAEVLHDFWPYTPIQVDKRRGLSIDCWF